MGYGKEKIMSQIPKGFTSVTPFLMAQDAEKVINFLKKAFDAKEEYMLRNSKGEVWHCRMKIGNATIMLADTMGMHDGTVSCQCLYVDDVDAAYKQAVSAGGKEFMAPRDEFYG